MPWNLAHYPLKTTPQILDTDELFHPLPSFSLPLPLPYASGKVSSSEHSSSYQIFQLGAQRNEFRLAGKNPLTLNSSEVKDVGRHVVH